MIGHTSGAAGAFNAAACCLAIRHGRLPPTIYYGEDPEIRLRIVADRAKKANVQKAVSNAFSTGGNTTTIVFGGMD